MKGIETETGILISIFSCLIFLPLTFNKSKITSIHWEQKLLKKPNCIIRGMPEKHLQKEKWISEKILNGNS